MNRSFRDYNSAAAGGARNFPVVASHHQHRRGHTLARDSGDPLDLFSRTRRSVSVAPSDESDVSLKLGKISVGSVKLPARNGLDDLLGSSDGGKNDYDCSMALN
uniref:Uncharacterized protein n=2 Tax=Opuntia streptacantha TaxID=393608 RepID=A0A7C9E8Y4_OPUST